MFSLLSFSSFFTTSVVSSSLFLSPHSFFSYFRSIRYSLFFFSYSLPLILSFFSLPLSPSFFPFFLLFPHFGQILSSLYSDSLIYFSVSYSRFSLPFFSFFLFLFPSFRLNLFSFPSAPSVIPFSLFLSPSLSPFLSFLPRCPETEDKIVHITWLSILPRSLHVEKEGRRGEKGELGKNKKEKGWKV